jgi:hypothetical protein
MFCLATKDYTRKVFFVLVFATLRKPCHILILKRVISEFPKGLEAVAQKGTPDWQ